MKRPSDHNVFKESAAEKRTDPAFVEKDWYAIQLLAHLNTLAFDKGVQLIFTGGTCLANAYGIIDRFSEDLDFIICSEITEIIPVQRGIIRKSILAHIKRDSRFPLINGSLHVGDDGEFVRAHFEYPKNFSHASLRPFLKIEISFRRNALDISTRNIRSMVANLAKSEPETRMKCISPVETAADKVSALAWRVMARDRRGEQDGDRDIVRHLYDLAALKATIERDEDKFLSTVIQSLAQEKRGGKIIRELSVPERLDMTMEKLSGDPEYANEYETYVRRMSYAHDSKRVGFNDACANLKELVDKIKHA